MRQPWTSILYSFIVLRVNRLTDENRLLQAAVECAETPEFLVQGAAREHIPVNPSTIKTLAGTSQTRPIQHVVPSPEERPSISEIIEQLENVDWYKEQIVTRRTTEARALTLGICSEIFVGDPS